MHPTETPTSISFGLLDFCRHANLAGLPVHISITPVEGRSENCSSEMRRDRASFEPSPCHRLEQIYFLTFVFLVRAADP